jgi:hypothetical protein
MGCGSLQKKYLRDLEDKSNELLKKIRHEFVTINNLKVTDNDKDYWILHFDEIIKEIDEIL